ncbi:MAG: hypothetical protein EHM64_01025 [Ignavibacteriae bacterium]|nr:MAG: hypothetical protein EHM64_01025 [Ignavibacteriota bacterium]
MVKHRSILNVPSPLALRFRVPVGNIHASFLFPTPVREQIFRMFDALRPSPRQPIVVTAVTVSVIRNGDPIK